LQLLGRVMELHKVMTARCSQSANLA
jgi:hypothetical protein